MISRRLSGNSGVLVLKPALYCAFFDFADELLQENCYIRIMLRFLVVFLGINRIFKPKAQYNAE